MRKKLLTALAGISDVAFSVLALNMAGVERAISSKLAHIEVFDIRQQPA